MDAGGDVLEQVAFHGSPYRFDRFSLDASGTGEGGAAHGHGLYFSADRNVATGCRVQLAGPEYPCKGRSLDDLYAQPERSGERDKMAVLEDFMVKHDLESMDLGDFDPAAVEWFKEIHKDIRGKAVCSPWIFLKTTFSWMSRNFSANSRRKCRPRSEAWVLRTSTS